MISGGQRTFNHEKRGRGEGEERRRSMFCPRRLLPSPLSLPSHDQEQSGWKNRSSWLCLSGTDFHQGKYLQLDIKQLAQFFIADTRFSLKKAFTANSSVTNRISLLCAGIAGYGEQATRSSGRVKTAAKVLRSQLSVAQLPSQHALHCG